MYVCMYIRHTLIAWARFLWSRPQTTSHVVLADQEAIERSCACESCNGATCMAIWYWSEQEAIDMCKRSCESQMGYKQSKCDR